MMIHKYKVPCLRDNLKLIRSFVNSVLNKFSLSELEVNQLVLAVDEICTNVVIYSNSCNPNDCIEINIEDIEDKLIFEIIDPEADVFDINQYTEPGIDQIVQDKRKGGMGLMLVNRIMDSVELKNESDKKVWILSKKVNRLV